jgi:HPr kinase/phosphorylase
MYLKGLSAADRKKAFDDLFLYDIPALVIARDLDCFPTSAWSARRSMKRRCCARKETTVDFTSHAIEYLNRELAPCITRHGVLLDIYGEGVMIHGGFRHRQERDGHRADHAGPPSGGGRRRGDPAGVQSAGRHRAGGHPALYRAAGHRRHRRAPAVRHAGGQEHGSQIDLVVQLEPWDNQKFYDRLGLDDHYEDILDHAGSLPVTIPVRPGRNLASIVEVAAMNNRNRFYGYNAAQELARRVDLRADSGKRVSKEGKTVPDRHRCRRHQPEGRRHRQRRPAAGCAPAAPLGAFRRPGGLRGGWRLWQPAGFGPGRQALRWRAVESVGIGIPGAVAEGKILYTTNIAHGERAAGGAVSAARLDRRCCWATTRTARRRGVLLRRRAAAPGILSSVTLGTGVGGGLILNGRLYSRHGRRRGGGAYPAGSRRASCATAAAGAAGSGTPPPPA